VTPVTIRSNQSERAVQQSIGLCLPLSPAISAITPSHVGGPHIPDTAYTACGADVRILQYVIH
jgi:hypothetical protein